MMMKNLALEWGHYGIRITIIVPGPIEGTEGLKRLSSAEAKKILIDAVPMRRMGTVYDIGRLSPLAYYISGCVVVYDGGSNLAGSGRFNASAEQMLKAQTKP
jgi:NAD(P)-dependent dehydrogenase (short-subunit alcohol dehydrogenase family)